MRYSARKSNSPTAFTLVELLVVIGIIALLISILLPALSAAKRQAAAAKCAAQLREIGAAFQMYGIESKGWYPPNQLQPAAGKVYNLNGVDYPNSGLGAYWFNFLAKYVTKSKVGLEGNTADEAATGRKSVLWGCPVWEGYNTAAVGGINRVQIGLGMNAWPTHSPSNPKPPNNHPSVTERVFITDWGDRFGQEGNFVKQVVWGRKGADRCLVADSLFWEVQAERVPPPNGMVGQAMLLNNGSAGNHAFATGNTLIDCYRHGKYPAASGDGYSHKVDGGKPAFNVLYADGHVGMAADRKEAFRACRLRYPE